MSVVVVPGGARALTLEKVMATALAHRFDGIVGQEEMKRMDVW